MRARKTFQSRPRARRSKPAEATRAPDSVAFDLDSLLRRTATHLERLLGAGESVKEATQVATALATVVNRLDQREKGAAKARSKYTSTGIVQWARGMTRADREQLLRDLQALDRHEVLG
jgi:hypothetical protein